MKKIHILGISLIAIFVFGAVSAAAALAVETAQWLVDGATIALGTEVNVDITTNVAGILLEDMNATLKPDSLCLKVIGLGFLYSNGEDRVETLDCTEVESMTSGVTCANFKPVDLPWLTQLVQVGTEFFDEIKNGGKGAPGWNVECTTLGIKVSDTCTAETGKPTQKNAAAEEVESVFPEVVEASEEANCTVGGAKQGLVFGSLFLDALSANGLELLALTVSLAEEVF